jgi:polysaccharide deacetylase/carbohydrate binding protein with CBM4/9 domain
MGWAMKRLPLYLSIFSVFAATLFASPPALAEEPNLIANPSVEATTSTGVPANWTQSKWGTNTAVLQHKAEGHTGSRSMYVSMTSRTDGDAKWMHDNVTVKPNTSYKYTSWYKSNISTEIVVQYTSTTGVVSYVYLNTISPSTSWQTITANFVTPANVAKASVLHLVAQVGWLQTDDYSLTGPATTTPPPANPTNLIANSSFETATSGAPTAWYKNNWGTNNAQFTYENAGHTGTKSAKVTIGSYTSGDAKWYAEPSNITPNKGYTYKDYYKSNVATRVVVAFIDASNIYTYQELAGAPASSTAWAQYSATFTAPANAAKVSVYHLIDKVGNLTLDDVSLTANSTTTPPPTPTIPNASLETAAGTQPANWQKNSWGTNTPTFQYVNEGRSGTKSAKITMNNYVDGDAKWFFDPITSLQPGSQYRFTTWYKTNVTPHAVAMFNMSDGSEQYFGMPITQPSGNTTQWQQYSDTFKVPLGTVSVSVFLYIDQNGWLQTDDYSLTPYTPTGFNRALLSMTFDDGHEENATTALPILNQHNLKTTQCFATSFIEGQSQQVINGALAFKNSGHEICSHSVNHPYLTTVTPSNLTYELQHSKQYLEGLTGQPVPNFASPYGDYNGAVNTEIKKHYRSHRTTDEGYNSKDNFAPYSLRVQNILSTTTAEQVAAWITEAQANKTWLILVYHRIGNNPGEFDSTQAMFEKHVQKIVSSGVIVKTTNAALDELTSQLP